MASDKSFANKKPFKPPQSKPVQKSNSVRKNPVLVVESSSADSESETDLANRHGRSLGGLVRRESPAVHEPRAAAARTSSHKPPPASVTSALPAIPQELLSRLVYDAFKDRETKITKEAMAALCKYFELFVQEAIFRAHYSKQEAAGGADQELLDVRRTTKLHLQCTMLTCPK